MGFLFRGTTRRRFHAKSAEEQRPQRKINAVHPAGFTQRTQRSKERKEKLTLCSPLLRVRRVKPLHAKNAEEQRKIMLCSLLLCAPSVKLLHAAMSPMVCSR